MVLKTMWQHEKLLRCNVQWEKKQNKTKLKWQSSVFVQHNLKKKKKTHDLLIGPAPTYSWTAFPVTTPLLDIL